MLDDGPVIGRQPLHRLLFGPILVLIDEHKAAAEWLWWRLVAINLAPHSMIDFEILFNHFPGLLRNYQQPNSELSHDRHRFRRNCGRVLPLPERFEGSRTNLTPGLAGVAAAFHVTLFERVDYQF